MDLKNLNVVELNAQEVKETEGGMVHPLNLAITPFRNAWQDIKDFGNGFVAGFNWGSK